MNTNQSGSTHRYLHFAAGLWKSDRRSDAELLVEFTLNKDEQAFSTLVGRHADLVWSVCFRVLRNAADAEDAFQASFLRLARDAQRIRQPDSLSGWLFRTARCCALDMRRHRLRQNQLQEKARATCDTASTLPPEASDLHRYLDEEIDHLPAKSRSALVLCCLQGRSYKEVALELGCSVATAHRWVLNARELLRRRLIKRGVSPTMLEEDLPKVSSGVTLPLLVSTVDNSIGYLATGLWHGSRASLIAAKAGGSLLVPMLAGASLLGTFLMLGWWMIGQRDPSAAETHRAEAPQIRTNTAREMPRLLGWPTTPLRVHGQAIDERGQPVANAVVVGLMRSPYEPGRRGMRDSEVARTQSDAQGRFLLTIEKPPLSWIAHPALVVLSTKAKHTPASGLVQFDTQGNATLTLRLTAGKPLTGQLRDTNGNPLSGARLEIIRIGDAVYEPVLGDKTPLPDWVTQTTTDTTGRFSLPQLGGIANVWARVHLPGQIMTYQRLDTLAADQGLCVESGRAIQVQVVDAEDGKPIAKAAVTFISEKLSSHAHFSSTENIITSPRIIEPAETDAQTDIQGRTHITLASQREIEILVTPPQSDIPWLGVRHLVPASEKKAAPEPPLVVTLRLPRGRWLSGQVVEKHNRLPLADAVLHWAARDAEKPEWRSPILSGRDALCRTGADGRFRMAVPAGEILVRAFSRSHDYCPVECDVPGTQKKLFTHFQTQIHIPATGPVPPLKAKLVRGLDSTGVVLNPDGSLAKSAMLLCADRVSPLRAYSMQPLPVRDGLYTLPGCDLGDPETVYLLEPTQRLGAVVELRGGERAPTVRLAPCGTIRVRILDAKGKPAADTPVRLVLLAERDGEYYEQPAMWFDPINHAVPVQTDAQGYAEITALIPGGRYLLAAGGPKDRTYSTSFRAVSGENDPLPDMHLPAKDRRSESRKTP
jgi:RNA polymerase sigma factor (sigma-70 family)